MHLIFEISNESHAGGVTKAVEQSMHFCVGQDNSYRMLESCPQTETNKERSVGFSKALTCVAPLSGTAHTTLAAETHRKASLCN